MAKEIPSVGSLRRRAEITDDEIKAATAAYLRDGGDAPFAFKSGHRMPTRTNEERLMEARKRMLVALA